MLVWCVLEMGITSILCSSELLWRILGCRAHAREAARRIDGMDDPSTLMPPWPHDRGLVTRLRSTAFNLVPLRDRCSFGRFTWLISQVLTVIYVVGEHRLYLERNCRLPESGPQETAESRGACQFQGAEQSARVRPGGRTSAKVEAAFHGFHGSSPCKCQRLSTLR